MRRSTLSALAALLAAAVAAPAGAQDAYRIGMSAAITGRAATTYAPTYEAYKVYFKRVNDAGGINGKKVEIEYEDDRGEPQRAAAAAKKLVEKSLLLVNASISATYKPFMTESETSKVPLLFGGGVCPREAFPPANPLIFCSTSFGSKWDSRFVLGFIKEQSAAKKVKIGFAAQDIPVSRLELEFAEQEAKAMGFDTIPVVVVPNAVADFTPFAQKLKDAGADWVFSWAPWPHEIGVFEALQRIGWKGNYILYGHQQTQDELARLKAPNLFPFGGNSLFIEGAPIHAEIASLVKGQSTLPAHHMSEGWVSAMVLEASLRACGWPCSREKLAKAMTTVTVDTKGLRGGPIEWTADNHYRKATFYKVYRWDPARNGIAAVGGWTRLDIK
ncbi:MAG: ABC transporter substrate-binding protein [Candidatus Rokubacteria bacterium]|nr:ABC transporter substrate-binding protein [Candidatus Rokubacteria bacterium]MBI2492551.1 ABC transporter substrate-binding protein [Candidatus Rokubacteria bacterium]